MTPGSRSHSSRRRCATRSAAGKVRGSSTWRRCIAKMLFLRTMSDWWFTSFPTSVETAGTMSAVMSRDTATSATDASRTLALPRSRCSWFTSMKRNSWLGARHAPHVTYPVRLCRMLELAASSTALMYPKPASWPSISTYMRRTRNSRDRFFDVFSGLAPCGAWAWAAADAAWVAAFAVASRAALNMSRARSAALSSAPWELWLGLEWDEKPSEYDGRVERAPPLLLPAADGPARMRFRLEISWIMMRSSSCFDFASPIPLISSKKSFVNDWDALILETVDHCVDSSHTLHTSVKIDRPIDLLQFKTTLF
mmetsp:Transcript_30189/g.59783  ORF Transcript_30189/g.59783 Transcript_30189/m.59783 type:complete len:310 (+) Transcript_30189:2538-3467(+)